MCAAHLDLPGLEHQARLQKTESTRLSTLLMMSTCTTLPGLCTLLQAHAQRGVWQPKAQQCSAVMCRPAHQPLAVLRFGVAVGPHQAVRICVDVLLQHRKDCSMTCWCIGTGAPHCCQSVRLTAVPMCWWPECRRLAEADLPQRGELLHGQVRHLLPCQADWRPGPHLQQATTSTVTLQFPHCAA